MFIWALHSISSLLWNYHQMYIGRRKHGRQSDGLVLEIDWKLNFLRWGCLFRRCLPHGKVIHMFLVIRCQRIQLYPDLEVCEFRSICSYSCSFRCSGCLGVALWIPNRFRRALVQLEKCRTRFRNVLALLDRPRMSVCLRGSFGAILLVYFVFLQWWRHEAHRW